MIAVVELRQYRLVPGRRDELIELFEQRLLEPQEAAGMRVLGTFRDLDDPDRFVWLRGFPDMESRRQSLSAFYGGPVWRKHRQAANATMVDSDDVLLLRPARHDTGFGVPGSVRRGNVLVAIASVETATEERERLEQFETTGLAALTSAGMSALGYFVTQTAENTFPALPVREGERVFVCFAGAPIEQAPHRLLEAVGGGDIVVRRLEPTQRSMLHGGLTDRPA